MKTKLFLMFLILFVLKAYTQDSQEMAYDFGYIFKKSRLSDKGKLFVIQKQLEKTLDTTGSFNISENKIYITREKIKEDTYSEKYIGKKLRGVVTERSGDTLFIKFWNITNENISYKSANNNFVNKKDNGKEFIFVIDSTKYEKSFLSKGKFLDLPFRFNQLMATNLPFRVLTKTGNVESDFLNANIAYLFVKGLTRIFDSEFIKPRNRYYALGPYIGLSSIDNTVTSQKEFGLNYGVNLVGSLQGLNVIIAYGFQNGFKKETKEVQPYIGFGIGFKLIEAFTPEIKTKDE